MGILTLQRLHTAVASILSISSAFLLLNGVYTEVHGKYTEQMVHSLQAYYVAMTSSSKLENINIGDELTT